VKDWRIKEKNGIILQFGDSKSTEKFWGFDDYIFKRFLTFATD
jgi:hypothetical protein